MRRLSLWSMSCWILFSRLSVWSMSRLSVWSMSCWILFSILSVWSMMFWGLLSSRELVAAFLVLRSVPLISPLAFVCTCGSSRFVDCSIFSNTYLFVIKFVTFPPGTLFWVRHSGHSTTSCPSDQRARHCWQYVWEHGSNFGHLSPSVWYCSVQILHSLFIVRNFSNKFCQRQNSKYQNYCKRIDSFQGPGIQTCVGVILIRSKGTKFAVKHLYTDFTACHHYQGVVTLLSAEIKWSHAEYKFVNCKFLTSLSFLKVCVYGFYSLSFHFGQFQSSISIISCEHYHRLLSKAPVKFKWHLHREKLCRGKINKIQS